MKVCVIGSGGREHALAWRLSISPSVTKVYAIPGSAAMSDCAELVGIDWQQSNHLIRFLKDNHIDLVVVGPEAPSCSRTQQMHSMQLEFLCFGPQQLLS